MGASKVNLGSGTLSFKGVVGRVAAMTLTLQAGATAALAEQIVEGANYAIRYTKPKEAQWKREKRGRGRR